MAIEALAKFKDALEGVVGVLTPFVNAIAPSVVLELNQAFADLNATIGSAFIGVIQVAASVVREISGVLLPVLQTLAPIFTSIANTLGTLFVGAVRLAIVPLEALAPILDILAGLFSENVKFLTDIIALNTAIAKVLKNFLQSLFGTDTSGLKDIFKGFFDILRQVIKALVTFAATLAVAAGAAGLVTRFGDALAREAKDRDERATGLKAAATNPQIVDVAAIARQAQLAAFTAAGGAGGREKTDTEWLASMASDLKKIAGDKRSLAETLKTWWDDQVAGPTGVLGKILKVAESIYNITTGFFNRISDRLGGGPLF